MAKTLVGALRVTLGLDSANFAAGAAKVESMSKKMAKSFAVMGAAVSAASAGIAAAVRKQINAADQMGEAAEKFGVPVEELSALAYVGKILGVQFETLATSLGRLSKGMANSPEKFDKLGIAVRDANGEMRPTSAVLKDIADKFKAMPDGAEKTALAMDLFGKSGADMVLMLNAGSDGIGKLMEEAAKLGLVITDEAAASAGKFNENLDKLHAAAGGLAAIIAAQLVPVLERVTDFLVEMANAFQNLSPQTQQWMAWAAGLTVVLGPLILGLGLVVGALSMLLSPLRLVGVAFLALPRMIALVATTFTAILVPALSAVPVIVSAVATAMTAVLAPAIRGVGAAVMLLLTPLGLKIAALAAIGAAIYALLPTMEELRRFWHNLGIVADYYGQKLIALFPTMGELKRFWENLGIIAEGLAFKFKEMADNSYTWVTTKFEELIAWLEALPERMWQIGVNIAKGIADGIAAGWESVKSAIRTADQEAMQTFQEDWMIQSPSQVTTEYGRYIAEGLAEGIGEGQGIVEQAVQGLNATAEGAMKGIGNLGERIGDMFATAATNVLTGVQSLQEAVGQLLQQLAQLLINQAMKQLFGNIFGGLDLGGYATGTFSAASGLALVGEQGPELINFGGGEQVYNAPRTARMLRDGGEAGGGVKTTTNVYLDGEVILSQLDSPNGEAVIARVNRRLGYGG